MEVVITVLAKKDHQVAEVMASLFLEQGHSEKALKLLKALLLFDQNNLYALKLSSRANFNCGHFDDAIEAGLRYIDLAKASQKADKLVGTKDVNSENDEDYCYPVPLCMILSRAYWAKGQVSESRYWARFVKESQLESES